VATTDIIKLPDGREVWIESVEDPKPGEARKRLTMRSTETGEVLLELESAMDDPTKGVALWSIPPLVRVGRSE
jgi:hypothetical protein